jgi:putative transposase
MQISPHANRLRIGRSCQTNQIYLLTAVTRDRIPFFADWRVGRLLVKQLRQAQTEGRIESLAWVVMPDHFHWLIQLKGCTLSDLMLATKSRCTQDVNIYLKRKGGMWQRGFHDHAIRREEDLLPAARYIVANPLRAGLVRRVQDYPLWDAIWV